MSPKEEWYEVPSAGRMRVQVLGEGSPVLFLHGVNTCGTVWGPLAARLHGFRCLLIDRPGCGLSDPVAERIDDAAQFASVAERLPVEVLDAVGVEKAHLVATSLGGYYALRTAARHPDRVLSVVQMGWSVGAPNGPLPLVMRIGGSRPVGRFMARLPTPRRAVLPMLRRIGLRQAIEAGRVSPEMVDWFHALLSHTTTMRNELDGSPPVIHPLRGMNDAVLLLDGILASIRVPVQFIWGDGDPFGDRSVARTFAAKIPDARLTLMDGAGHAVWMDDPDKVAAMTAAALRASS